MNDDYRKIYRDLAHGRRDPLSQVLGPYFNRRQRALYTMTQEIVERRCRESKTPIRDDAQFYLTTNLFHMILLPIYIHAQGGDDKLVATNLLPAVDADCVYLIGTAGNIANSRATPGLNEREVTGRDMMNACSQVYENLKVAAENIWG